MKNGWKKMPLSHGFEKTMNSNKMICFACKKSIDLNVMGKSALVSHMKGKKHKEYVKNLQGSKKTTKTLMLTETFLM